VVHRVEIFGTHSESIALNEVNQAPGSSGGTIMSSFMLSSSESFFSSNSVITAMPAAASSSAVRTPSPSRSAEAGIPRRRALFCSPALSAFGFLFLFGMTSFINAARRSAYGAIQKAREGKSQKHEI
jgi:hypothetical protein